MSTTAKEIKLAKGVKDWHESQALLRNHVKDVMRSIFERYAFIPLETPLIEREEVLTIKGGAEIQKEIFRLQDQGKRALALRFDHTVPLARFYATHSELKTPFKRYAIGEVFRDGPTQPEQGRYRIFTQCDVDIIGVASIAAEVELLTLASDVFHALGLGQVNVRLNNRKVLDGIMDSAQIPQSLKTPAILILDKLDKIGKEAVRSELHGLEKEGLKPSSVDALLQATLISGDNVQKTAFLNTIGMSDAGAQGLDEIRRVLDFCEQMSLEFQVNFDPSLARGLDYYTGSTFEVFLQNKDAVNSAIAAGGRFDNMIGDFRGADETIPAVGVSFGLERVCMTLESLAKDFKRTVTQLLIIPLNTLEKCFKMARAIRSQELNVEVDMTGRSLKSAMRYAGSLNIPFVGIVGDNEAQKDAMTVKRLSDGLQKEIHLNQVVSHIKQLNQET